VGTLGLAFISLQTDPLGSDSEYTAVYAKESVEGT